MASNSKKCLISLFAICFVVLATGCDFTSRITFFNRTDGILTPYPVIVDDSVDPPTARREARRRHASTRNPSGRKKGNYRDAQAKRHMKRTNDEMVYTIPKLADLLGVTPASVRNWIKSGLIDAPPRLPVTDERAYSSDAAAHIQRWYMRRAANGGTRGPGANERRQRGRAWLADERGIQ